MSLFPLRYVRQNVLFGLGGETAALYRLDLISYPFLPVQDKWALLRRLERLATVVGADFSLWRVSRAYPADRYVTDTLGLLDDRLQDPEAWRSYLAGHRRRLERLAAHVPEVYLAVSLTSEDRPEARFGRGLVRQVDRARRRIEDLAGVGAVRPISAGELEALVVAEQRVHDRLSAVVACERATSREIEWLLRRSVLRGVGEPRLERFWQPDALVVRSADGRVHYEPLGHDLLRLVNAPLTEAKTGPAKLTIEAEDAVSYQALLCLGSLADAPTFPGPVAEFLYAPLEAVEFPVDAVLHARWVGNRDALAQVRRRITDVEHTWREQAEGSLTGPGWVADEDRGLAREFESTLQGSAHPPMLYATVSLAVGAPSEAELEERVTALQDQYGELVLQRPRGLQEQLFFDHLPRAGGAAVRDYTQQMSVEQFAAGMPTATQQVGATRGVYIGYTLGGRGRPVHYDITEPSREARTSAVLLAGTLGSGKTVAAELLAYSGERRGSLVVDFDPKPDHGLHRIPALDGRLEVLELSAGEEHRGKLDPLAIGLDDLREELACSYFLELLREPAPAWENQIQRAVRDVVRRGGRSSLQVIDQLRQYEQPVAGEVADALEVVSDFGLARLGFGDGTAADKGVAVPLTTIRTPGLTLPDPHASRETYTRSERVSVATLALVAAYALRLVASDRSRHKVVLLDEAWFLLASPQGRAVINRLVRLGRAFNATVLLATQRLSDLGDLQDLIGTYLIFGQESEAEASRALELIGLDPEDRTLNTRLREFRKGRCLMRDLDGHVAEVQIDAADPQLLAALDTTPRREGR